MDGNHKPLGSSRLTNTWWLPLTRFRLQPSRTAIFAIRFPTPVSYGDLENRVATCKSLALLGRFEPSLNCLLEIREDLFLGLTLCETPWQGWDFRPVSACLVLMNDCLQSHARG